jgi:MFS family permease
MRQCRPFPSWFAGSLISLARYSALLAQPTLRSSIGASFLGRLPIGITGLAILMLAQSVSDSFARGGSVAACYTLGLAVLAPALGRLIDRRGPRHLLLACAFAFPASLLALIAALHAGGHPWIAAALAIAAGASFPPITVCMRTFLKQRLKDDALLAAAYSLESVLIETIFIVGPLLVAFFVAVLSPAAAVAFAAACGFAGTLLFRGSRALAEWRIEPRRPASLFGPLAEPGFGPLLAVVVCYAGAFGLVEIGTMAYAAELGRPAFAGVLLGIMSVSSAAGGLVYGSRSWGLPLARQFPLALAVMGLGVAPLAALQADWMFLLWCLPAGLAMSPALIMQAMLVAKRSRPEHSTEAFTWSSTALLAGVSLGLTLGGFLLEYGRSSWALGAAAALSVAAGLLALRLLRLPARA